MIIAVDFDNTLVRDKFPEVGFNLPYAFETLRELQENGHKIILLTQREHISLGGVDDILQVAIDKVESEGINLYSVNENPESDNKWFKSRKCYANIYIDDHGAYIPTDEYGGVDWLSLRNWLKEKGVL